MDIIAKLAAEFKIKTAQVEHTVELIDEGNTIPFICQIPERKLRAASVTSCFVISTKD